MSTVKESQREGEVGLRNSIEQIRDYATSTTNLFGELKLTAEFIVDLADQLGLTNKQIEDLKKKIESLFLTLNESMFLTSGRIINELEQNAEALKSSYMNGSQGNPAADVSLNISQTIPYEELYIKYNNVLSKNVELTANITELSNRFNELQKKFVDEKEKNTSLDSQIRDFREEKESLEQQLHEAREQLEDHAKENQAEEPFETTKSLVLDSTLVQSHVEEFVEKAKTADDFIAMFNKVFKGADEIVQLVKHLGQTESTVKNAYAVRALEKSRTMRQVMYDVLEVFRKAKVNPSILGSDVGAQVAEELKRIYETLSFVKKNTEKHPIAAAQKKH